MQKRVLLAVSTLAMLPLCSHGAANVSYSSGKFSSEGQHMTTGKNGSAQVGLDAQGSLVRLGSNTVADLGNEREITLGKGLLLVASGEGFLRRAGVVIHTAAGEITVRGTAMVAVLPDGAVKLTCLEGSVRGDLGGQGVSLHPSEMIIQRGNGTRDLVQVNLHTLTQTSTLLNGGGFKPLHSAGSIDHAVAHQGKTLATAQQQAARQNAGGHGQGETGGFFTRLFSGNGNTSTSAPNQTDGSVGGATMRISGQGGSGGSVLTIANTSGVTLSSGSMVKSEGSALVMTGAINSNNSAQSTLIADLSSQRAGLTISGGTTMIQNVGNTATVITQNNVAGGTLTLTTANVANIQGGAVLMVNGSSGLTISSGTATLTNLNPQNVGTAGAAGAAAP